MARSGFKKAGSGGGQTVLGAAMALAALAVLGGAIWAFFFCETCRPRDLSGDLCPKSGPVAYVAVIIDTTDRVSPLAQTEIGKILNAHLDGIAAGTKLGLYLVEDQTEGAPNGARRVAALCHPGQGEDVNILTESRRDAQELFDERFLEPVDAALQSMLAADSANTSPIAEALRVAAADLLPYRDPGARQTVILVSDMIQNSARFSFFRGDSWQSLDNAAKQALSPSLQDVDIKLIEVLRPNTGASGLSFDTGEITAFWRSLLAQGQVRTVERLAQVPAR